MPNGFATVSHTDLSLASVGGGVSWVRYWDGREWKFNPHWESLSVSWSNLTGGRSADGGIVASMGQCDPATAPDCERDPPPPDDSSCTVWVDENWQPSGKRVFIAAGSGMSDGSVAENDSYEFEAEPAQPIRSTPFNRVIGGEASSSSYGAGTWVNADWPSLCGGGPGGGGGAMYSQGQELEGIRRVNELYLGEGGRYAFSNRSWLEKRPVKELPIIAAGQLASGRITLSPVDNPKGYRWGDRSGAWIDYNTQGQVVAYGERNQLPVWLVRNEAGAVLGAVDANGRVLFTLHYTGDLITEVRDYPVSGLAGDLPARSVHYRYDAGNRLSEVTDVRGHVTRYGYDRAGRIIQITDAEGRIERLAYKDGVVSRHTAADGGVTDYAFSYDDVNKQFNGKITGPVTAAGRLSRELTHNRIGKLVRQVTSGKTDHEMLYDSGARIEASTNSRGHTTKVQRNEFEQIIRVTDATGASVRTTYSAIHLEPTERVDQEGFRTTYTHDDVGNLLTITRAVGTVHQRVIELKRNALGQVTEVKYVGRTEPNGTVTPDAIWLGEYDEQGQLKRVTDPEGHAYQLQYDRAGNLISETDALGHTWRYEYDAAGNTVRTVDPLGFVVQIAYDKVGNMLSAVDEEGRTHQWRYNPFNQLSQRINPLGEIYETQYNALGQVSQVKDAAGKSMALGYDALARLSKGTDGKSQSYELGYAEADGTDKNFRLASLIRYPTFQRILRYNERSLVSLSSDNVGPEGRVESYAYDKVGRRKTFTDAEGKTYYYEYSPHGQATQMRDPLGNTLRLVHDVRGNVIEVIDPRNGKTTFTYDRRDLMVSKIDPLGHTTHYRYDAAERATEVEQANGQKTVYSYDDAGRVTQQRQYNAQGTLARTIDFRYDKTGNLLEWEDAEYKSVSAFDGADRLLNETLTRKDGATAGFSLTHSYTDYGNGQTKTYTGPDGQTISYTFDAAAELESVTIPGEGIISVSEWQWYEPTKIVLPGGSVQRKTFNGYQNLTRLQVLNPAQATVFDLQNEFGKLADVTRSTFDGASRDYTKDDAGRLVRVEHPLLSGRGEAFTLDANNNRVTHSRTGTLAWQYDNVGQLTQRPAEGGGSITYTYDAAGNLSSETHSAIAGAAGVKRFTWDALNRLSEVRDGADQLIARYIYDPFDRRIRKETPAGTTHYLHSDWGLLAEANAAGQVQVSYGWNPQRSNSDSPLYARIPDPANAGASRYVYYHNDQLGTPQRITDKAGNVVWAGEYDAFGKATVSTSADPNLAMVNQLRFPGQYFDAETGLHYNDRRYYDPATGRYLSRDPIGFEGGINLYAYAGAAPHRFTDPTGEKMPPNPASFALCNLGCNAFSALADMAACGPVNWGDNAIDCGIDCLFQMLPIPNPCGKFGNSFSADVEVHVKPKGASSQDAQLGRTERKAIKDLRPGDEVLALAEWKEPGSAKNSEGKRLDQRLSYEKVIDIVTSHRKQTLVHITMAGGQTITATEGHPFKTTEGWRDAILLRKGGQLLLKGSGDEPPEAASVDQAERIATIEDIRIEKKTVPVFNLEVANAHTFFVGDDGVLVHNGFGSYTCTFKSGKRYHGKGDWDRANKSGNYHADKNNDPLVDVDWTPAKNDRDAFKDEHRRMMTDPGGHKSPDNYNQRASPGRNY
ncbi:RHS repeat-associated core domain-containing protein [Hydrogenophaga flava]|uniref:RHS repeat-associated core domain-containing protein n=1 Tax=Hydrogenophaga flava TaxID=65657 RepID=UPI000825DB66|nr:RHS repeat-associated core domain-containing protein [Hydrogenophaga flava]